MDGAMVSGSAGDVGGMQNMTHQNVAKNNHCCCHHMVKTKNASTSQLIREFLMENGEEIFQSACFGHQLVKSEAKMAGL
ncbi:unnamed protein product [Ceratitis capitata]|uniref:(Mediterranean fruit fly) hypothetical protein n=1 Tax=Ceratitis capitata TaxID=7213 RepID=A0A811VEM6_CERCA|nr:unnamed protein product [Ceratitis capitata]